MGPALLLFFYAPVPTVKRGATGSIARAGIRRTNREALESGEMPDPSAVDLFQR